MKNLDWKACIRIGVTAFVLYLCIHYWGYAANILKTSIAAVLPVIVGAAIAYPLNILMSFYERHLFKKSKNKILLRCKRGLSLTAALLSLASVIALVIALVVPQLSKCFKLLIDEIPGAIQLVAAKLESFDFIPEDIIATLSKIDWQSTITSVLSTVTNGIGSVMDVVVGAVSSFVSGITTALLAVIFAIYLLLNKDKLMSQLGKLIKHYVPEKITSKGAYVLEIADDSFHKFIVAQFTEAMILGLLCTVGMLILQLPYAAMIGAVIAVTAFIPVVGGLIGGAVGVFLIFMESPTKALIFLIFLIALQQLEGDLIYPKVVGSSIGLPGIWVLAAVTVGGGMFGILGMLLGVPVASTVYRLIKLDIDKREKETGCVPEGEENSKSE